MADDSTKPPKEPVDPAVPPAPPASDPKHHLHMETMLSGEQRDQLEKLSLNLARAALTAPDCASPSRVQS